MSPNMPSADSKISDAAPAKTSVSKPKSKSTKTKVSSKVAMEKPKSKSKTPKVDDDDAPAKTKTATKPKSKKADAEDTTKVTKPKAAAAAKSAKAKAAIKAKAMKPKVEPVEDEPAPAKKGKGKAKAVSMPEPESEDDASDAEDDASDAEDDVSDVESETEEEPVEKPGKAAAKPAVKGKAAAKPAVKGKAAASKAKPLTKAAKAKLAKAAASDDEPKAKAKKPKADDDFVPLVPSFNIRLVKAHADMRGDGQPNMISTNARRYLDQEVHDLMARVVRRAVDTPRSKHRTMYNENDIIGLLMPDVEVANAINKLVTGASEDSFFITFQEFQDIITKMAVETVSSMGEDEQSDDEGESDNEGDESDASEDEDEKTPKSKAKGKAAESSKAPNMTRRLDLEIPLTHARAIFVNMILEFYPDIYVKRPKKTEEERAAGKILAAERKKLAAQRKQDKLDGKHVTKAPPKPKRNPNDPLHVSVTGGVSVCIGLFLTRYIRWRMSLAMAKGAALGAKTLTPEHMRLF